MSLAGDSCLDTSVGFPRVSGDEPGQDANKLVSSKFSPRERG